MPASKQTSSIAAQIATASRLHDNNYPLWHGPYGDGLLGGITQSMLVRFLSCRERFRLKYVLGLDPHDRWNHRIGYGNMWHVCEEAHANNASAEGIVHALHKHTTQQLYQYPMQREEIEKWYCVCTVQFPEYVKHWSEHPDVKNRTPLMQEQVFDVPYTLPSGRTVRLRGKFDSVDLITDEVTGPSGGVYLQENKTKGDINKLQVEQQLKFDLQTNLYLIALKEGQIGYGEAAQWNLSANLVKGVRYNVVRRPLSGGKGNISPHKAKSTKYKFTPAETDKEFYERLCRDYIAAEPDYWFFRVRSEISARDIQVFRETCLDPLLETLCWWYDEVTGGPYSDAQDGTIGRALREYGLPPMNYRTPFGIYSALEEGGATEYDAYLETGSEAGLRRVETLFTELQ
jgi:hypothetical protein